MARQGPLLVNHWKFLLALGVSLALLLLLLYRVNIGDLADALTKANYLYVIPAIPIYFLAVYFRAVRWRFLLTPLSVFPASRLYPVVIIGYMANNVLPARLGELVRSYYLARRERGVNASSALATIAVERVYDGLTLLSWAAVAAPVLLLLGEFEGTGSASRATWVILAALTASLFVGALAFLTCLAVFPRTMEIFDRLLLVVPERIRPKISQLIHTFVEGLLILSSPRKHLTLFLLSMPVWALEASMYLLISYSFGIDSHFGSIGVLLLVVLLLTATSNLATSLPISIGGIGTFEVVAQQTLIALGIDETPAGAYAIFLHVIALWLPVNLAGLAIMWKQNLSLSRLAGEGQMGSSPESPVPQGAAGHAGEGIRGPNLPASPSWPPQEELP